MLKTKLATFRLTLVSAYSRAALLFCVSGLGLLGCAPQHQNFGPGDAEYYFTGGDLETGVPYVSSDPRVLSRRAELERAVDAQELSQRVIELAQEVESVSFVGLTSASQSGQPTTTNPQAFELTIQLKTAGNARDTVVFRGPLEADGESRQIRNTRSLARPLYSIQGFCSDPDCRENFEIEFERVKSSGGRFLPDGKIDLYGRGYWATAETRSLTAVQLRGLNAEARSIYDRMRTGRYSYVQNWAVPYGASIYQASVYKHKTLATPPASFRPQNNPDQLEWLLTFQGPAALTSEHQITATIDPRSPVRPSQIFLYGDTLATDERLFRVTYNSPGGGANLELALEVAGFEVQASRPVIPGSLGGLGGVGRNAFLRTPTYDTDPLVKKFVDDLESNWNLEGVQSSIVSWVGHEYLRTFDPPAFARLRRQSQGVGRDALTRAYQSAFYVRPLIEAIYSHFNIPPPLIYIQLIETPFWRSESLTRRYNPLVVADSSRSTACGPSQFLSSTAQSLGMYIRPGSLDLGRRRNCLAGNWADATGPNRRDERVFPAAAICATARYMAQLSKVEFAGKDQTFAVAGYYLGPDGARSAAYCAQGASRGGGLSCLQAVDATVHASGSAPGRTAREAVRFFANNNMSFAQLSRYRSVPNRLVQYTHQFLAKYFISGNPTVYGVPVSAPEDFDVPPHLFPPAGWESRNWQACERAVGQLPREYLEQIRQWSLQTEQRINEQLSAR